MIEHEPPRIFVSGMNSPADFAGVASADAPIGLQVAEIGATTEKMMMDYNARGGHLFIDSGAFTAFMKQQTIDFDQVLRRYRQLGEKFPRPENVAVVAPDVVGNMDASAELQQAYLRELRELQHLGLNVLVPFQKGWGMKRYRSHYQAMKMALTAPFTIAIPCNAKAWGVQDLAKMIAAVRPDRVHLLGVGKRKLWQFVDAVLTSAPNCLISADANRVRAMIGEGRPVTEHARRNLREVEEQARQEFAEEFDSTEYAFEAHNTPGYFTQEQARMLAKLFGVSDEKEIERWARWSQEESSVRQQSDKGPEGWSFGCKLGYLLHEADPTGLRLAVFCGPEGEEEQSEPSAIHAAGVRAESSPKIRSEVIRDAMSQDQAARHSEFTALKHAFRESFFGIWTEPTLGLR